MLRVLASRVAGGRAVRLAAAGCAALSLHATQSRPSAHSEAAERVYTPPPAKLDDPVENAQILENWRAHIERARVAFRSLDISGAERELQLALELAAHFGSSSGPVATSMLNLAQLYRRAGRSAEAEPLLTRSVDVLEQTAGPNNKVTLLASIDLASTQHDLGKHADAAETFADTLERLEAAEANQPHGRSALRTVRASLLMQAAKTDVELGRLDRADARLHASLTIAEELWGAESPRLAVLYAELAAVMLASKREAEARGFCARAEALADKPPVRERIAGIRKQIEAF